MLLGIGDDQMVVKKVQGSQKGKCEKRENLNTSRTDFIFFSLFKSRRVVRLLWFFEMRKCLIESGSIGGLKGTGETVSV